jgi:hypothetical protein
MNIRRNLAVALSVVVLAGPMAASAVAQNTGTLAGRSNPRNPNYEVRIQSTDTNQVVGRMMLDPNGQFSIGGLALPGRYLVVLYDTSRNRVVCTEGAYALDQSSAAASQKLDVVISCGRPPAALLLGALAGGTARAAETNRIDADHAWRHGSCRSSRPHRVAPSRVLNS